MSGEGLVFERLSRIGLTDAEAQVYLALLKKRAEMDAKDVSEASGIPYSKVYTVLEKLATKSLITIRRGRPAAYMIKMPSEGLNEYRRLVTRDVEEKFEEVEAALDSYAAAAVSEKPDIWIIKNPHEITRRAHFIMNKASREVDLALPSIPSWEADAFLPTLLRLKEKKVWIKILLSSDAGGSQLNAISKLSDLKIRDRMFGGGIIVDEAEAILFIASDGINPIIAIWSNHAVLVQMAKTYFDNLWVSSTPFFESRKLF